MPKQKSPKLGDVYVNFELGVPDEEFLSKAIKQVAGQATDVDEFHLFMKMLGL